MVTLGSITSNFKVIAVLNRRRDLLEIILRSCSSVNLGIMELDYSLTSVSVERVDDADSINEVIKRKIDYQGREGIDDPFYLVDLNDVVKKCKQWQSLLPRVAPFYAMKALPEPAILELIARLGLGFDCASKNEIEMALKAGATADRIIYAHTSKPPDMIRFAAASGVSLMTFDNEDELHKIKRTFPEARLVLRILPPKAKKVFTELGDKFGCPPSAVRGLLQTARSLQLSVVGVSFHVGFGCQDPAAYVNAVEASAAAFEVAASEGFAFSLLDIGGGFPGHPESGITIEEIVEVLSPVLDRYFPVERGVRIIAEPGTFFVGSAMHLAAQVIGRRVLIEADEPLESSSKQKVFEYYLNDGLYGSFCRGVEGCRMPKPVSLCERQGDADEPQHYTVIYGPTRESTDVLFVGIQMAERQVGDWVIFPYMGHYTIAAITAFEGMPRATTYYVQMTNVESILRL